MKKYQIFNLVIFLGENIVKKCRETFPSELVMAERNVLEELASDNSAEKEEKFNEQGILTFSYYCTFCN